MSDYESYKHDIIKRFWRYKDKQFKNDQRLFEQPQISNKRPPVFLPEKAHENVIVREDIPVNIKKSILNQIPKSKHHRWFRSMTSSQALTQSVFGNLKVLNKLAILDDIVGDDKKPVFIRGINCKKNCELEYIVDNLGEPRPTNVDVFFNGNYRIAIECKLTEDEVGPCSAGKRNLKCDGQYKVKKDKSERCPKTSIGAKYWEYIPKLFYWSADIDYDPCPLLDTYQLVRNILAVSVNRAGELYCNNRHAVLLYDERNPAFQPNGRGLNAWQTVKDALKYPLLLQKCTWQQVLASIRREPDLDWISDTVFEKYGL